MKWFKPGSPEKQQQNKQTWSIAFANASKHSHTMANDVNVELWKDVPDSLPGPGQNLGSQSQM